MRDLFRFFAMVVLLTDGFATGSKFSFEHRFPLTVPSVRDVVFWDQSKSPMVLGRYMPREDGGIKARPELLYRSVYRRPKLITSAPVWMTISRLTGDASELFLEYPIVEKSLFLPPVTSTGLLRGVSFPIDLETVLRIADRPPGDYEAVIGFYGGYLLDQPPPIKAVVSRSTVLFELGESAIAPDLTYLQFYGKLRWLDKTGGRAARIAKKAGYSRNIIRDCVIDCGGFYGATADALNRALDEELAKNPPLTLKVVARAMRRMDPPMSWKQLGEQLGFEEPYFTQLRYWMRKHRDGRIENWLLRRDIHQILDPFFRYRPLRAQP